MDASLWIDLLGSISSFCSLPFVSFGLQSVSKNHQTIKMILELLKPTVDSFVHENLATNEVVSMATKQLVQFINIWANLFEDWHPSASRIHQAVKAELLMIKILSSVLVIVRLLKDSCQYLPAELSLPSFKHFIQKLKKGNESISTLIKIYNQKDFLGTVENWGSLAHLLGFESNLEILVEIMALKKLKVADQIEYRMNPDHIEQLINLFMHIHNHLFQLKQSQNNVVIPVAFRCRLSLNLMVDPVIVASGQTYERAYISKWFNMGFTVCPSTWTTFGHTNMIPNYTCKALITNWCELNKMKSPESMNSTNEPFNLFSHASNLQQGEVKESTEKLIIESSNTQKEVLYLVNLRELKGEVEATLKNLKRSSVNSQREAMAQLLLFAKKNMKNRILIRNCGGIKTLVDLLQSSDIEIQQNAVTTLLYLAINDDNKIAIAYSDAIEPLIHVLQTGTPEAQENSAGTLFCLSMIHENKLRIGDSEAIGPLIELLRTGTPRGRNNAIIALFNLSIAYKNKTRIVRAGGTKLVVELSRDPITGLIDKAVATLASLSRIPEGRAGIEEAGGIPVLVQILELGSAKEKQSAVYALVQLCVSSYKYCDAVVSEGAVPPLVALARSGTPKAREKAQLLLSYFDQYRSGHDDQPRLVIIG